MSTRRQRHESVEIGRLVLDADLDLLAGRRLKQVAVDVRPRRGLERSRIARVGREADLEERHEPDAPRELVVRLLRRLAVEPVQDLVVDPVVAAAEQQDEAIEEPRLVLRVEADLVLRRIRVGDQERRRDWIGAVDRA
jgi:hypothetical protein